MTTWNDGTTTTRTGATLEASLRAIANANATTALAVTQTGNASASTSAGGAVNITNTGSTGAGLVIYSNQAAPSGRLLVVRADNATFNQAAARIQSAGTGAALEVSASGTGAGGTFTQTNTTPGTAASHALTAIQQATSGGFASAANIVSSNPAASCVQVTGAETGRGSIKVTHLGDTAVASDANAAALSIDLQSSGASGATAAQGIFIEATTGGTTGNLVDIRNNGNHLFKFRGVGLTRPEMEFKNGGPVITAGAGIPAVAAPVGSLYLRTDGGTSTTLYVKESGTGTTGWVAK